MGHGACWTYTGGTARQRDLHPLDLIADGDKADESEVEQNTTTKKPQQLKAVSVQNGYDTYKAGSLLLRALYSDRHHLDRLSHTQAQSLHPHTSNEVHWFS